MSTTTIVSAGSTQVFTASSDGAVFTVVADGSDVGFVTDEKGVDSALQQSGTRRSYGPLSSGQAISVTVQLGAVSVISTDASPSPAGTSTTLGPSITGDAGVGKVLTATPPAGWSASGWQWYRDGSPISGATSQTYTQVEADIGAVLTVAGSGWVFTSSSGVAVPEPAFPFPRNVKIIGVGDSRTSTNTELSSSSAPLRVSASQGFMGYALTGSGHRFKYVGNYGVGGDKLANIQTRLGNASVIRDNILTAEPGASGAAAVFLAGVNNVSDSISVTGPLYDSILTQLIDAGYMVVVCNELPNSDQSGSGATHYARRQYLDTWPDSSPTLTAGQKVTYRRRRVLANTYDVVADPQNIYYPRAGLYMDGLHPAGLGNRLLGDYLAGILESIATNASLPLRNVLPATASDSVISRAMMTGSVAITATNSETAGAGGANMDGAGAACVTGSTATGWVVARSSALRTLLNAVQPVAGSQLSVVVSKFTDSNGFDGIRFNITGQVGTTGTTYSVGVSNSQFFNESTIASPNGIALADGSELAGIARVRVPAAKNAGLLGFSVETTVSSAAYAMPNGPTASMSGAISTYASRLNGAAEFDRAVLSQGYVLPTGFVATAESNKNLANTFSIHFSGGTPIDIQVEVSRFGMVKNR